MPILFTFSWHMDQLMVLELAAAHPSVAQCHFVHTLAALAEPPLAEPPLAEQHDFAGILGTATWWAAQSELAAPQP